MWQASVNFQIKLRIKLEVYTIKLNPWEKITGYFLFFQMVFIMNIGKSIPALTDLFFYEKTLLKTSFDKWIQLKVIFKWKVITLNYKLFNYILNSSNFSWKVLKGCSNTSKLSTYVFLLIFHSWKQLYHHQCKMGNCTRCGRTPAWKAFTSSKIDYHCLLMKNNPLPDP